jgi:hypothetical protein
MTLDEILALLGTMTLCDAAMWFVEHMTYDAPHREAVYQYLCERRAQATC